MTFHHSIEKDLTFANLLDTQGTLVNTVNNVLSPAFTHLPSPDEPAILCPEKFAPRRKEHERKLVIAFANRMQKALREPRKSLDPTNQGRILGLYIGYLFARKQQDQEIRTVKRFRTIKRAFLQDLIKQFELHLLAQSVYSVDYDAEAMVTGALQEYDTWLKEL